MLRMQKSTDVDYHPKFYLELVLHTSSSFPPFYHRNGSDDKHTSQLGTASTSTQLSPKITSKISQPSPSKATIPVSPNLQPSIQAHVDVSPILVSPRIPLKELQLNKLPSSQLDSTSTANVYIAPQSKVSPSSSQLQSQPKVTTTTTKLSKCCMKSKQSSLQCSVCGKQYGHRSSLFKHMKNSHPDNIAGSGHIQSKEKNCNFKFSYINVLHDHLTTKHSLHVESEELSFQSEEGTYIHTCTHVHTHICFRLPDLEG